MGILAPLYLTGLAALSLPLILHLIRRTPRGRQEFSSLMFLAPSPPPPPPPAARPSRIQFAVVPRPLAAASHAPQPTRSDSAADHAVGRARPLGFRVCPAVLSRGGYAGFRRPADAPRGHSSRHERQHA